MACQNQIKKLEQSQVSFPTEIVVDILLTLPVESLLRCRAVCKLWHSLISDPYFIHSKYLASTSFSFNTNMKLIFSRNVSRREISICNLSDTFNDTFVSNKALTTDTRLELNFFGAVIAASCNGLVCLYDEFQYQYMFFWNPTTKVYNRISLGFYLETYGFGYDESTDDYKFLAICQSYDLIRRRYSLKTRIYSLKTEKWKTIGDFPDTMSMCHGDGKYSNGALHWVAVRTDYGTLGFPPTILSFHLATETYGQVLQPPYHDEDRFYMSLGALREELCMLCYYYGSHSDIWVMKVYGVKESWTKLFSLPYMPGGGIIPSCNTPLFISKDGKILFENRENLVVYDSKNGSSFEIRNFMLYGKACTFVESLVSPMPTDIDDLKESEK